MMLKCEPVQSIEVMKMGFNRKGIAHIATVYCCCSAGLSVAYLQFDDVVLKFIRILRSQTALFYH